MADTGMISIHEMRRRAPAHYWAKADNARYLARLLSLGLPDQLLAEASKQSEYGGSPGIAIWEGFRRESALALELIIKAVIARKLQVAKAPKHVIRIRLSHDIPKLWDDAGLPKMSKEDRRRLLFAKTVLSWSGRYAAPKDDTQYEDEVRQDRALKEPVAEDEFRIEHPLLWDWDNFDRLYRTALTELNKAER